MGRRSKGSKSFYLKVKLEILGAISYWLAGLLTKVDTAYSRAFIQRHGHKRLKDLMAEEVTYWRNKYKEEK
jgi:hypothetical protein